ncbi:hypothetical protein STIAU_2675, partial [Stigmatella aurantiaca DW4/3-1]
GPGSLARVRLVPKKAKRPAPHQGRPSLETTAPSGGAKH